MKKMAIILLMLAMICAALIPNAAATQHTLTAGSHKVTFDTTVPVTAAAETTTDVYLSRYNADFDVQTIRVGNKAYIAIAETKDSSFDGNNIDTELEAEDLISNPRLACSASKTDEITVNGKMGHKSMCDSPRVGEKIYASVFKIDEHSYGTIVVVGNETTFNELTDSVKAEFCC